MGVVILSTIKYCRITWTETWFVSCDIEKSQVLRHCTEMPRACRRRLVINICTRAIVKTKIPGHAIATIPSTVREDTDAVGIDIDIHDVRDVINVIFGILLYCGSVAIQCDEGVCFSQYAIRSRAASRIKSARTSIIHLPEHMLLVATLMRFMIPTAQHVYYRIPLYSSVASITKTCNTHGMQVVCRLQFVNIYNWYLFHFRSRHIGGGIQRRGILISAWFIGCLVHGSLVTTVRKVFQIF